MRKEMDALSPFYTFAVEHAAIGIHAIDRLGNTIIYNNKMKQIEGLALEDVQDRSILELFNFDQAESTLLKVLQSGHEWLNVKQTYWNRDGIEITTINDTYPVYDDEKLIGAIELSRDVTALEKSLHQPDGRFYKRTTFNDIIAESASMKTVISTAEKAAKAKLSVLLIGETGTGKELIAESIHNALSPSLQYFYTLHCHSSDPLLMDRLLEDLRDSESYTVFCERIELLSIPLQKKLLSLLSKMDDDNRQFIASIGDDPVELIASGSLLKELYYFFSSFAIRIPPLRKRREDIMPFLSAYLHQRSERYNSTITDITPEVKKVFEQYEWPGNIRELEILLDEITSLASTETVITYSMLPLHFRVKTGDADDQAIGAEDFIVQRNKDLLPLDDYLYSAEEYYIKKAMKLHDHNITRTANALGMSRQSLQYRLRKINKIKK